MSNTGNDYSDEFLNAFIDGELDQEETGLLLEEIRHNQDLSDRLTDLQKIREMVRYAYHEKIPDDASDKSILNKKRGRMAIAASILLSLGVFMGWQLHLHSQQDKGLLDIAEAMQVKPASADKSVNMVLHVTSSDDNKLDTILSEAEKMLAKYAQDKQNVKLDVLTNGPGLKLVHAKHSPFAARIQALQTKYKNLTFKACKKAIKKLQKQTGKTEKMLPETVVVPSALGEIMQRQQDGWSYIKI